MFNLLAGLAGRFLLLVVIAIALVKGAMAHDILANGGPVPSWIKGACCGPNDYHVLKPDQVHETPQGWRVDGYRDVIPYGQELPSPDGSYAIFYVDFRDGSQSRPFCFFVPPRSF